jgi:hypothetical protein
MIICNYSIKKNLVSQPLIFLIFDALVYLKNLKNVFQTIKREFPICH